LLPPAWFWAGGFLFFSSIGNFFAKFGFFGKKSADFPMVGFFSERVRG
jgi:hypothetical protein